MTFKKYDQNLINEFSKKYKKKIGVSVFKSGRFAFPASVIDEFNINRPMSVEIYIDEKNKKICLKIIPYNELAIPIRYYNRYTASFNAVPLCRYLNLKYVDTGVVFLCGEVTNFEGSKALVVEYGK